MKISSQPMGSVPCPKIYAVKKSAFITIVPLYAKPAFSVAQPPGPPHTLTMITVIEIAWVLEPFSVYNCQLAGA